MKLALFVFITLITCGCKEKQMNKPVAQTKPQAKAETPKEISIKKIGELRFRRSYAAIQYREMSDAELESIRRSNPEPDYFNDSILVKKFQTLGLVNKQEELLLKKFKSIKLYDYDHPEAYFTLEDSIQKKLIALLCRRYAENEFNLWVSDSLLTAEIGVEGFYPEGLKFMLVDVIPGGYKEVVILNNYYIMNGDNSDLLIYEIKHI